MIDYVGTLPASKSLFNRSLIIQSLNAGFETNGSSDSDDVRYMKIATERIASGDLESPFQCGHAGTTFRFLAFRLAREKGVFYLRGSSRLFSRPQEELRRSLAQLGASTQIIPETADSSSMQIDSAGWRPQGDGVFISGKESSQYASGLLLSAWNLGFPLAFTFNGPLVSADYFLMTVKLCRNLGMTIEENGREWYIPPNQKTKVAQFKVEIDLSSAFSVAALAVMGGQATLVDYPQASIQPDAIFLDYFRSMNIDFEFRNKNLKISTAKEWDGLTTDLNRHPDLLPVLSVLCAYAKTQSCLTGLDHLAFKESNRITKSKELIEKLGAHVELSGSYQMTITPTKKVGEGFTFDPDQDHRMAMAAAVANARGARIQIENKNVVNKSFPGFWQIAGEL